MGEMRVFVGAELRESPGMGDGNGWQGREGRIKRFAHYSPHHYPHRLPRIHFTRSLLTLPSVESLFGALSTCSALHDSLLPTGEPSSFFGFGDDGDDDDDGDAAFEDADESGGRVRSDFYSGGGPGARFAPY
jgi:hypothetical protein